MSMTAAEAKALLALPLVLDPSWRACLEAIALPADFLKPIPRGLTAAEREAEIMLTETLGASHALGAHALMDTHAATLELHQPFPKPEPYTANTLETCPTDWPKSLFAASVGAYYRHEGVRHYLEMSGNNSHASYHPTLAHLAQRLCARGVVRLLALPDSEAVPDWAEALTTKEVMELRQLVARGSF